MSKVEDELLEATGIKGQKRTEDRDKYIDRLLTAVEDLPNEDEDDKKGWESLSKAAQDWVNSASVAEKNHEDYPEFPDVEEEEDDSESEGEEENGEETESDGDEETAEGEEETDEESDEESDESDESESSEETDEESDEEGDSDEGSEEEGEDDEGAVSEDEDEEDAAPARARREPRKAKVEVRKPVKTAKKVVNKPVKAAKKAVKTAPKGKGRAKPDEEGKAPNMRRMIKLQVIKTKGKASVDELVSYVRERGSPMSEITVSAIRSDTRATLKLLVEKGHLNWKI